MNKITFTTKDGLRLGAVWQLPRLQTDKVVILAHGITDNKDEQGNFVSLAKSLNDEGIAVFRFDFRGHGESEGKSVDMTLRGEIQDLEAAVNEVKKQGFGQIGLLGASFGGGVATLYTAANQDKMQALCLWNPVLNYEHTFLEPTLPWILEKKKHMKHDLETKGWTTLGSRKMVVGNKLFEEMAEFKPFEKIKDLRLPILIVHGDKDTKVPYSDSVEASKDRKNISLLTIKDAEHGFHQVKEAIRAIVPTVTFFTHYLDDGGKL